MKEKYLIYISDILRYGAGYCIKKEVVGQCKGCVAKLTRMSCSRYDKNKNTSIEINNWIGTCTIILKNDFKYLFIYILNIEIVGL